MKYKANNKITNQAPSLLKVILLDIFVRHWIVSTLAFLFIYSAITLVKTSHDKRNLMAEWQSLRQQDQEQQMVWESLRLEITSLSEANRISNLAKKQLNMIEVSTRNEKVISL